MIENTEERKIRIMAQAKRYAEGYISLRDFYESELKENDDIREQERQKLREMVEEFRREKEAEERLSPDLDPSGFNITREEYNKLNLREQSKLYEEHPREIRKLLGKSIGSRITKEQFGILTSEEQETLFREKRGELRDLFNGRVDSVDVEGLV